MKSYKFRIAILIFFILILSGLTTYLISKGYHFSVFFSIAAILFLAIKLYRQIEKAIEVMERMIISIQYTDFNISFARSVQEREFKHLCQMMDDAIRSIPDFPPRLASELKHCIVAHHGELEYGSPKKPALAEALALNFADCTDAKMQTLTEIFREKNSSDWLGYNRLFESNLRKTQG